MASTTTGIYELLTGSSTPLLASGDVVCFVDVSDTSQSPQGSLVKGTLTQFFAAIPVPIVVTSASANALAVGLAGATNPAFVVDASTALSATGLKVKSAAAASGVALSVVSSGTNENLKIDAKGSGTITIASVSTGTVTISSATTAVQALTATTGTFTLNQNASTTVSVNNSDVASTASRAQFQTTSGAVIGTMVSISTLSMFLGTSSAHDLNIMTNGSARLTINATTGAATFAAGITATTGTFSGALSVAGLLQMGGTTSAFPALKRSATTIQARLADDSGYAQLTVGAFLATGNVEIDGSTTLGAPLLTTASVISAAGLNIPHGSAPTSPVNGDLWTTTSGMFVRINGVTKTVTLT